MSTSTEPRSGLLLALEEMTRLVDLATDAPTVFLSGAEAGQAVVEVERLASRLAGLSARLVAQASSGQDGWSRETDLRSWLAASTQVGRGEAGRRVLLARSLERDHPSVLEAMERGECSAAQAKVIVDAVDALGGEVDVETRARARTHLVDAARRFDPASLRQLGRRVLEVLDPDTAAEREVMRLAAEEAAAARTCSLSMGQAGDGTWVGRFVLPDLAGQMLRKALTAIANPARPDRAEDDPDGEPPGRLPRRPAALRLGEAFCEYVERFPASALPAAAGGSATVVVTLGYEQLTGALAQAGVARLDDGGAITASEARRLACAAGVLPMVLGGASQPLDLGRERRLHSKAQRVALTVRDGGCAALGDDGQRCGWPPGMCHAHHVRPWSQGGPTTVADGELLCPRHHRRAHDLRYEAHRVTDPATGRHTVDFHRRT